MYDVVNNLVHNTGQVMHIVYITFAMFSKHYLVLIEEVNANMFQEGIIIYTKFAMFIKQSPTRLIIITKNDTKTRHKCLISICGHLIQKCLLIA